MHKLGSSLLVSSLLRIRSEYTVRHAWPAARKIILLISLPSIFSFIIHNPLPTCNVIHHEQQEDSHHVIPCTVFRCRVTFCFAITRPAVQWAVVTVQACANALLCSVTLFCCVKASTTVDSRDNPGLCPCSAVTLPALSWSYSRNSLGLPWFCCDNASSAVTSRDNPGLCPFSAVTRPAPPRPCCRDSLGLCPCSAVTWPALPWTVVTLQACAHVLLWFCAHVLL